MVLAGSFEKVVGGGGEGAGEVFVGGAAFFCANLPEPRALASLANIVVIFECDGGVEGRRAGVLALDLAGAGDEVVTPAGIVDEAGSGVEPVLDGVNPGTTLTVVVGEGSGEV